MTAMMQHNEKDDISATKVKKLLQWGRRHHNGQQQRQRVSIHD
jgi:hypothetical protein